MSVSTSKFVDLIDAAYREMTSTNPDGSPILDSNGYPIGPNEANTFPDQFAQAYHQYSLDGSIPGAQHGSENPSIIANAFRSSSVGSRSMIDVLASAFSSYWAGVLVVPSAPAHGGNSVVSVTNNALALQSSFRDEIINSMRDTPSLPNYQNFISNIETVVKSIVWDVVELMPPNNNPSVFQETLS